MRRRLVSGFLAMALLTVAGAVLSACNTVHGMGQDLESADDSVKNLF